MKTIPSFKDFLQLKEQAKVEENQLVIAQEEVANVAPMSQVHAEDVKGFTRILGNQTAIFHQVNNHDEN